MRIFKYSLAITDLQIIALPVESRILTVQMQHNQPTLWAMVDESITHKEARKIAIYGTGNPMPNEPGTYISTFQSYGGDKVWHVFEVMND